MLGGDRRVFAYLRHGKQEDLLVVHNLGEEAVAEYKLNLRGSTLSAGQYKAYDLLGESRVEALEIVEKGAFVDYVPVPELEAGQTLVLLLD